MAPASHVKQPRLKRQAHFPWTLAVCLRGAWYVALRSESEREYPALVEPCTDSCRQGNERSQRSVKGSKEVKRVPWRTVEGHPCQQKSRQGDIAILGRGDGMYRGPGGHIREALGEQCSLARLCRGTWCGRGCGGAWSQSLQGLDQARVQTSSCGARSRSCMHHTLSQFS